MSGEVFNVTYPIGDPGGDNKQLFMFQAPTDAIGGGITIVGAKAVTNATLAGAGTTFTYQLLTYSNAGTPAVSGTITTVIGSATQWTAAVPQAFTISDGFVDAGEYVVIDYQELASGNPTLSSVMVQYVMGK